MLLLLADESEVIVAEVINIFDTSKSDQAIQESLRKLIDEKYRGKPPKRKTPAPETETLPACIDPETWKQFLEHRVQLKSPMSAHARTLLLNKLEKHSHEGHDTTELLNTAIMNGWKSVYPPRPERRPPGSRLHERVQRELAKEAGAADPNNSRGHVLAFNHPKKNGW